MCCECVGYTYVCIRLCAVNAWGIHIIMYEVNVYLYTYVYVHAWSYVLCMCGVYTCMRLMCTYIRN